ncbi:MAG: amidohydrolase [Clostridiales bacterium]|nr:amidohydrolase [Clostridiales bacterium]
MDIYQKIDQLAKSIHDETVALRQDFHTYPEIGWFEMRTSAIIARHLTELGYEVLTGRRVCQADCRMGTPDPDALSAHYERICHQNTPMEFVSEDIRKGFTGVIGILRCGEGPVVALRFDIDALPMTENPGCDHRPTREGFASRNPGWMHACGHDSHIAMGLGTAWVLMQIRGELHGTIKLIFQPAEEGARGAKSIAAAGHLDDVDYFAATHIAPDNSIDDGDITPGTYGSLATTKLDVEFQGLAAHAGGYPEKGLDALQAAAHAAVALAGIPRNSGGMSRINVGTLHAGSGRNVVPDHAVMELEVRGETTEINTFMAKRAGEICESAARMTGCTCGIRVVGEAPSQVSDLAFVERIRDMILRHFPQYKVSTVYNSKNWGSEDIGFLMERVQAHGGQAVYMRTMTAMPSAQHTTAFDLDEKALDKGISVFAGIVYDVMNHSMLS